MTKPLSVKKIRQALLDLGFQPCRKGNGDGYHEWWEDSAGRHIKPRFEGREMHIGHVFPLADSLQTQGACTRQEFIKSVRSR